MNPLYFLFISGMFASFLLLFMWPIYMKRNKRLKNGVFNPSGDHRIDQLRAKWRLQDIKTNSFACHWTYLSWIIILALAIFSIPLGYLGSSIGGWCWIGMKIYGMILRRKAKLGNNPWLLFPLPAKKK